MQTDDILSACILVILFITCLLNLMQLVGNWQAIQFLLEKIRKPKRDKKKLELMLKHLRVLHKI